MPRKPKDTGYRLLVDLPAELAFDLVLFCEAHYSAPKNVVIRKAIEDFLRNAQDADPSVRARMEELRVEKSRAIHGLTKPEGKRSRKPSGREP